MNLKQSLILLILAIVVFPSNLVDGKNYDKANIKRKILTQTLCPTKYSAYVKNSTAEYENDIRICGEEQAEENLKLKKSYEPIRTVLLHDTDSSCQTISECDIDGENISAGYDCLWQRTSKSSALMKNMSYKASLLQLDYTRQEEAITYKKGVCTNSTTELLNERTNAAIAELKQCFQDGKWKLPDLVPGISEPTTTPVVTETFENSIVFKKPVGSIFTEQNIREVEEAGEPELENEM